PGIDGPTVGLAKDQVVSLPRGAGRQPLGRLPPTVLPQHIDQLWRQRDRPPAAARLRGVDDQAATDALRAGGRVASAVRRAWRWARALVTSASLPARLGAAPARRAGAWIVAPVPPRSAPERRPHRQRRRRRIQVDIGPSQRQRLALAQAERQGNPP